MSTSSKSKILLIAVIVLLLTNIGMLFFFLKGNEPGKKNRGRDGMMTDFLQKDVGFTAQQLQLYDTMAKQHHELIKASFDSIRINKQQWYRRLGAAGFDDSTVANTAALTSGLQQPIEYKMLLHFQAVRKLCTPEQLPKFDSLFYKIWDRKSGDKKKDGNK